MKTARKLRACIVFGTAVLFVAACQGQPELGSGGSVVQGSAGPEGTQTDSTMLASCDHPIGNAALVEPEAETLALLGNVGLRSPTPVLRLMMAQSHCFQVVDRGAALGNIETEERLRRSGMLQSGSTTARGRMVAVDYLITPNIIFSNPNAGGYGGVGALGGIFGWPGLIAGAVAGSIRIQEAQTVLFLSDAHSGVQTAAAEGSAKVKDFGGAGGILGFGGGIGGLAGVGGYGNTAEGKLIVAALVDAHNKLVAQVRGVEPKKAAASGGGSATSSRREPPPFEVGRRYVPVVVLNVRSAPNGSASVVTKAQPGIALVPSGQRDGNWWEVESGDSTGWVHSGYLQPAP
jgi:hypothetical protein